MLQKNLHRNNPELTEATPMIEAKVVLTQPNVLSRQFVATTGSGHHLILDDPWGGRARNRWN